MQIFSIVGARPQFIKAAVFSRQVAEFRKAGKQVSERLVHTGQHYDFNMSHSFFAELSIPEPDLNLNIHGGTHGEMTGQMLIAIESDLVRHRPDLVVVYGDTNSTMAGALAAAKLNIPIAHIEAGMRHYRQDIPEEINRVVTDHVCTYLFCSSEVSRENLAREGIAEGVHVTGDLTYDLFVLCHPHRRCVESGDPFVVTTIHRAANTDNPERLADIMKALTRCPCRVIFPIHPRTRQAIERNAISIPGNITIREPVGYHEMLGLLDACRFVVTDSGGLQKDAYFSGKRVITLSNVSPWTELVQLDANRLVDADIQAITDAFLWAERPLTEGRQPYGDGHSAAHMLNVLLAP